MKPLRHSLLPLLLVVLLPLSAHALEATIDGIPLPYYLLENGDAVVGRPTGGPVIPMDIKAPDSFVLPASLDGHRVVSIAPHTFYLSPFTSITLPEGITNIAEQAFLFCPRLTSIHLPTGLLSIGAEAFSYCDNLASVNLPEGLTSLAYNAFLDCQSIASISIPSTLTAFDTLALIGLPSLHTLTVHPNNPTYSSRDNILFSKDFTDLLFYAPANPQTSYTIPNSVFTIGPHAFYAATNLTSISLRASVESIGESAFRYCTGLTSITIPGSISHLPEYSFSDCTSLSEAIFLHGFQSYIRPFGGCTNLSSVIFPSSLANPTSTNDFQLGYNVPTNTTIFLASGTSYTVHNEIASIYPNAHVVLEDYLFGIQFVYEEYEPLDQFNTTVPYDTAPHTINTTALEYHRCGNWYEHNALPSVSYASTPNGPYSHIPPTFTEPGTNTVYYVLSFGSWTSSFEGESYVIILPPESLDFEVHNDTITITGLLDPTLTSLSIPSHIGTYPVTSIADHAFWKCASLTSISLPDTLSSIGDGAFWRCSSLTSITLPASLTSLGEAAFFHCSNLSEIILDGDSLLDPNILLEGTSAAITRIGGTTTASGIPHYWLREHVPPDIQALYPNNMDALEALPAANAKNSYAECYIAGLNPADPSARFQLHISFHHSLPILTWTPHLPNRSYILLGSPSLSNPSWQPCNPTNPPQNIHFFRVKTSLP